MGMGLVLRHIDELRRTSDELRSAQGDTVNRRGLDHRMIAQRVALHPGLFA